MIRKRQLGNRDSPFATRTDKKPDENITPFLKLLWDNKLIDCYTSPKDSKLATRIRVQKLVYFAQHRFGLKFRYKHKMYLFGPYSIALTNDYYRIENIGETPGDGLGNWGEKEKFLSFAKSHDDNNWLEIASTLLYIYDSEGIKEKDKLIDRARILKPKFKKEYVVQAHNELEQMKFLEA